jgi:anti-anti-sigma factor
MEVKVSTAKGRVPVTILHVTGNIDSATHMAFQAEAEEQIKGGARHLLIDLSDVPFMSSAGLRAISALLNQLRTLNSDVSEAEMLKRINEGTYKSPHLKLLNLSKQTRTAFETAGFDMYIETFTDREKAIASF